MIWKRIKTKYPKVDHPSRAANKHRYPPGAHDKFSPIHSTVVQFTSSIVYLVHINYTSTDFQLASISRKQVLTSMQLRRSPFPPPFCRDLNPRHPFKFAWEASFKSTSFHSFRNDHFNEEGGEKWENIYLWGNFIERIWISYCLNKSIFFFLMQSLFDRNLNSYRKIYFYFYPYFHEEYTLLILNIIPKKIQFSSFNFKYIFTPALTIIAIL